MVFVIGGLDPTIHKISETLRFCSIYMLYLFMGFMTSL